MTRVDRKGFILGTIFGLMFGAVAVRGYSGLTLMFSCSTEIVEAPNIEVIGQDPTKGFYSLTFNDFTEDNQTKKIELKNKGMDSVILTWESMDLHAYLKLKIISFDSKIGWTPQAEEWKEHTNLELPGNSTTVLYITLINDGAEKGVHDFYLAFHSPEL